MPDCLQSHGLQHARFLCPPLSPRVWSNSYPLTWWWFLTTSSSAAPFSFCLHSFPASGSFLVSWLFASNILHQNIGAPAFASVLPINIYSWFPLALTGSISLQSKRLSRVYPCTAIHKRSVFWCSAFFMVQLSHLYMTPGKTIALTIWQGCTPLTISAMSLLFNTLSGFVIAFLSRSRHLLISWLQPTGAHKTVAVAQEHQYSSRARALRSVRNPTLLQTVEQQKGSKSKCCLLYRSLITSPKQQHMLPFSRRNEWGQSQGNSRTRSGLAQVVHGCYPSPTLVSHPKMISGLCGSICPMIEAVWMPSWKI